MTLSPETLLATATRTIVVCNACGCDPGDEPAPVRGCPEHGLAALLEGWEAMRLPYPKIDLERAELAS